MPRKPPVHIRQQLYEGIYATGIATKYNLTDDQVETSCISIGLLFEPQRNLESVYTSRRLDLKQQGLATLPSGRRRVIRGG